MSMSNVSNWANNAISPSAFSAANKNPELTKNQDKFDDLSALPFFDPARRGSSNLSDYGQYDQPSKVRLGLECVKEKPREDEDEETLQQFDSPDFSQEYC